MQAGRRSPSGTLASPRVRSAMGLSRAGSKPWTVSPYTWQRRKHPPTTRHGGEHGAGTKCRIERRGGCEKGNRIGVRVAGRGDGLDRMSNEATNGYAEVNGLRMYFEVHGSGRPLVLLHGAFGTIE